MLSRVQRHTLSKPCGRRSPGTGRPAGARTRARRTAELPVVFGAAGGGGGAGVPHQGLPRRRSEGHALFPASLASSQAPGSPAGGAVAANVQGWTVFHLPSTPWVRDGHPIRILLPGCEANAAVQCRTVLCGRRRRFSGHAAALRRARAGAPACNVSSACFFPRGKLDAAAFLLNRGPPES